MWVYIVQQANSLCTKTSFKRQKVNSQLALQLRIPYFSMIGYWIPGLVPIPATLNTLHLNWATLLAFLIFQFTYSKCEICLPQWTCETIPMNIPSVSFTSVYPLATHLSIHCFFRWILIGECIITDCYFAIFEICY